MDIDREKLEADISAVELNNKTTNWHPVANKFLLAHAKRLAKACRALLAAMPREWDATTIKDAPDGLYRIWDNHFKQWDEKLWHKQDISDYLNLKTIFGTKAYGPLPQSPTVTQ